MVLRPTVVVGLLAVVALSGCVQSGGLALQTVETPEFATVFVQSDDEESRKVRVDLYDDGNMVASKVYWTPDTGLAREPVLSTEVALETMSVHVYVDGRLAGTVPGPDRTCRMGEAFVDVLLEDGIELSSRCIG